MSNYLLLLPSFSLRNLHREGPEWADVAFCLPESKHLKVQVPVARAPHSEMWTLLDTILIVQPPPSQGLSSQVEGDCEDY
jgi:hypothetical protein